MKKIHSAKALIASAAMAGLIGGATNRVHAMETGGSINAGQLADYQDGSKHSCKGKNDCKGQGGCSSGDGGCAGKNSCKGKGGCTTSG
jgi:hypothetical protein